MQQWVSGGIPDAAANSTRSDVNSDHLGMDSERRVLTFSDLIGGWPTHKSNGPDQGGWPTRNFLESPQTSGAPSVRAADGWERRVAHP